MPRLASFPCKETVESLILFGSTYFKNIGNMKYNASVAQRQSIWLLIRGSGYRNSPEARTRLQHVFILMIKQGNHGNGYALGTKLKQIICFAEQINHLV